MSITLKLLESPGEIEKFILSELSTKFNKLLLTNKSKLFNGIISLLPRWLSNQPEMQSLLSTSNDSLIGQFGINSNTSSIVNTIIDSIINSTSISLTQYSKNLTGGGLEINIQPTDYGNLLSLPQGHTKYYDGDLHWLNWLLTRGDETIVVGYEYNPQNGVGRSKLGNMKPGGSFRVPPQFSGTVDNNFITRALTGPDQIKEITNIFQKILES